MTILGLDVSHFQGAPNFAQVKASGRDFVVIKATEGTGYIDPMLVANRAAAHAAGLTVGLYHFARAGDAAAEAAYFLRTVGPLRPGEFVVLDWEVAGANPPAWCKQWLDAVYNATGVRPLIYMNRSAMNSFNWMPLSGDYALWLASYDGSPTPPATCNCWSAAAMKQYSDAGSVPGVAGTCDVNVFFGGPDQLAAFSSQQPQEIDMQLTDRLPVKDSTGAGTVTVGEALAAAWEISRGQLPNYGADGKAGGTPMTGQLAVEWFNNNMAAIRGQIAGLQAVVTAQVTGQPLTADQIQATVEAAVKQALTDNTVHVDVNVAGAQPATS